MKDKLNYLKYPFLRSEIEKMGYELEGRIVAKACLILYIITALVSYFYKLQMPFILFLTVLSTLCVPYRIFCDYRNQYEKKKYLDLTVYMEQMLYSFKRHPKILEALRDTGTVFAEGQMETLIQQAIHIIQEGGCSDLYEAALAGIEAEYGCQRLRTMHQFLIKVEQRGGRYKDTADLLLEDRERWKTSTELLDKEKKTKRKAINIVLVATLVICGIMTSIFGALDGISVTDNIIYQTVSTVFVTCNLLIFSLASDKLGGSWEFKEKDMLDEEKTCKEYELIQSYDLKAAQKKARFVALAPAAIALAGICLKNVPLIFFGAFFCFFLLSSPKSRIKSAKKKVTREIEKAFPQWLMELTLLLQTENVYVSLTHSMDQAPKIMRGELQNLLAGIDELPNSIEPYHQFFYDLHIEDVTTSMKILYSVSAFDAMQEGEAESPISNLIQRNNVMMNKSEQIAGEEKLAIWTVVAYLPMAIGGVTIIIDMVLLIGSLITAVATF